MKNTLSKLFAITLMMALLFAPLPGFAEDEAAVREPRATEAAEVIDDEENTDDAINSAANNPGITFEDLKKYCNGDKYLLILKILGKTIDPVTGETI